jgi:hypothetical protein
MATPISKGKASETKNDGQMQIDTSEGHAREVPIYDIDVAETAEKKRKTVNYSPTNATTQDLHPYARGAVIEVWYRAKKEEADDWWSEPESEEDDDESVEKTVRLCDVIDRAQNENTGKWRYYVHYKDFNRRMDEWISVDRIVSPPSVGNAKARALKKEEEREKKKRMAAAPHGDEESPDSTRQRCRVTPGRGNPRESATENRPPCIPLTRNAWVRVKRWGKSPPRDGQPDRHGKPHREQCRIGTSRGLIGSPISPQGRLGPRSG